MYSGFCGVFPCVRYLIFCDKADSEAKDGIVIYHEFIIF